jgi:hypothetical protein
MVRCSTEKKGMGLFLRKKRFTAELNLLDIYDLTGQAENAERNLSPKFEIRISNF